MELKDPTTEARPPRTQNVFHLMEARSNVLVSMLHMSKGIISCVSAVCICMVFGVVSHARIDAISTLPENGGKADPESVPDALCPHEAPLFFADKPTAPLDARNRKMAADMLLGQTAHGASVMPAAHDLGLAQACTAVLEL